MFYNKIMNDLVHYSPSTHLRPRDDFWHNQAITNKIKIDLLNILCSFEICFKVNHQINLQVLAFDWKTNIPLNLNL